MKISGLKAGRLEGKVTGEIMANLVQLCEGSDFNHHVIGGSWEENGVIILRPKDISEGENGDDKIETIAVLLGMKPRALRSFYFLEIWDDR